MTVAHSIVEMVDTTWLKQAYFSDPARRLHLAQGEVLLQPNELNDRLYLILEGEIAGYIESDEGEPFEIFRSTAGMFVGVYSYFSDTHRSYATVQAEADSVLAYVDRNQPSIEDALGRSFAEHFLPVMVNEVYMRQLAAQRMSIANQMAMRQLYQSEKMATLGQLAAGLAHELNNAIGVIQRKSEWLSERMIEYFRAKDTKNMFPFLEEGFRRGQWLSSSEIRERKKELEKTFGLDPVTAKKLARTGLSDDQIRPHIDKLAVHVERITYYLETGIALHDIKLATNHAAHVVRSVKELGAANREIMVEVDLNHTLHEALSLVKKMMSGIETHVELGDIPMVKGNPGDFVQVWVNLIKNASESLVNSQTPGASITLRSLREGDEIAISVIDNGPGIPPEIRERIFQPNVTTKVQGLSFGLGLGLSIVQKLVEGYGGQIRVDSHPGHTAFVVSLPIEDPLMHLSHTPPL
ncbi:MAG: ATP-binding protein [Bacteroidia bacterium]